MDMAEDQTETDQDPEAEAGGNTEAIRTRIREAAAEDHGKGLRRNTQAEVFLLNQVGRRTSYSQF